MQLQPMVNNSNEKVAFIGDGWNSVLMACAHKYLKPDSEVSLFLPQNKNILDLKPNQEFKTDETFSWLKLDHPLLSAMFHKYTQEADRIILKTKPKYMLVKDGLTYGIPQTRSQFRWNSILFFPVSFKILYSLKKKYSVWTQMSIFNAAKNLFGETFAEYFASVFSRATLAVDAEDMEFAASFPEFYKVFKKSGIIDESLKNYNAQADKRRQQFSDALPDYDKKTVTLKSSLDNFFISMLNNCREQGLAYFPEEIISLQKTGEKYELKSKKTTHGMFDQVFFSCAPEMVAQILANFNGELSAKFNDFKSVPLTSVYSVWDTRQFKVSGGGVIFPRKEKSKIYGAQFLSNLFPEKFEDNKTVIRSFVPGDVSLFSDDDISGMVHDSLRRLQKNLPSALSNTVIRHSFLLPRYAPGFSEKFKDIHEMLYNEPGLRFSGWYYAGFSPYDNLENLIEQIN